MFLRHGYRHRHLLRCFYNLSSNHLLLQYYYINYRYLQHYWILISPSSNTKKMGAFINEGFLASSYLDYCFSFWCWFKLLYFPSHAHEYRYVIYTWNMCVMCVWSSLKGWNRLQLLVFFFYSWTDIFLLLPNKVTMSPLVWQVRGCWKLAPPKASWPSL